MNSSMNWASVDLPQSAPFREPIALDPRWNSALNGASVADAEGFWSTEIGDAVGLWGRETGDARELRSVGRRRLVGEACTGRLVTSRTLFFNGVDGGVFIRKTRG